MVDVQNNSLALEIWSVISFLIMGSDIVPVLATFLDLVLAYLTT